MDKQTPPIDVTQGVGEERAERMSGFARMALDTNFSDEFIGNVVRANLDLFNPFARTTPAPNVSRINLTGY